MKRMPKISGAEWEVMRVLWEHSPRAAQEIISIVSPDTTWKPKTVKTLLGRLVAKGAVGFVKEGKEYLYSPKITREESTKAESEYFMNKVFGGAMKPMIATFIDNAKLSAKDIEELKQILDAKGKKHGSAR